MTSGSSSSYGRWHPPCRERGTSSSPHQNVLPKALRHLPVVTQLAEKPGLKNYRVLLLCAQGGEDQSSPCLLQYFLLVAVFSARCSIFCSLRTNQLMCQREGELPYGDAAGCTGRLPELYLIWDRVRGAAFWASFCPGPSPAAPS